MLVILSLMFTAQFKNTVLIVCFVGVLLKSREHGLHVFYVI